MTGQVSLERTSDGAGSTASRAGESRRAFAMRTKRRAVGAVVAAVFTHLPLRAFTSPASETSHECERRTRVRGVVGRMGRVVVAAALACLATVTISASPAAADGGIRFGHPYGDNLDRGTVVWWNYDRSWRVCDTRSDGHGVAIRYVTYNGYWGWLEDTNGGLAGCAQVTTGSRVVRFQYAVRPGNNYWAFSSWRYP
jgi:hypothetical protein